MKTKQFVRAGYHEVLPAKTKSKIWSADLASLFVPNALTLYITVGEVPKTALTIPFPQFSVKIAVHV